MKKTGIVINTNNLAGYKDGQIVPAKEVRTYVNGKWVNVKRILTNKNLKTVWEVLEYLLQANDTFTMPPSGGLVESNLSVVSRLNKSDGTYDWVEYTVNPSNIPANTGTTSKEHEITITQKTSNFQITSTCIQEGDTYYGIVYETPVVNSVTSATAEAVGEDVMLTVRYTQKVIRQYASGNKEETISGTINPTIDSGSAKVSNVTRNGKYIEVPSAGTDKYTSDRTVYTVTGYSFTVNGKTKTVTGVSIDVKQEANIVEYTTATDGGLSISAYPETVPAANHGSEITVTCYKNVRDVYTSGAYGDPVRENAEATLTSSTGTFYPHSPIMGGSTTMFSPYENSTNQKVTHTVNASVRIGSNTYTDSCTIIQDPVSYEFEVKPLSISGINYLGQSDIKVNITSTKNGNQLDISRNNISVSGSTGLSYDISLNDVIGETGAYTLTINIGVNSTSSTKTFYVTVTQPESGNSETITIYQAAKPSSGGGGTTTNARATIAAYFLGGDYSAVRANIELNEDAVTLGKTKNVIVELQNVTNDVIDSYTNSYPVSSSFENTLANGNMESDVWVVVKCNNIELGRHKVEE